MSDKEHLESRRTFPFQPKWHKIGEIRVLATCGTRSSERLTRMSTPPPSLVPTLPLASLEISRVIVRPFLFRNPLWVFRGGVGSFWKKHISCGICISVTLSKRRRLDRDSSLCSWVEVGYSTNLWPNCPFNCNTGSNWKSARIKSKQSSDFYRPPICGNFTRHIHLLGGPFLNLACLGACHYLLQSGGALYSLNRLFARPYTIMNRLLFAYQRLHLASVATSNFTICVSKMCGWEAGFEENLY